MKRTMTRREAELQIDDWYSFYEQGLIDAEQLEHHVECVAALYRIRRNDSRYHLLDK